MNPIAPTVRCWPITPRCRGGTVLGLLFGIAVGALIALGAAWYVTRHSPFRSKEAPPPAPTMVPQELLGMLRQTPPPAANDEAPGAASTGPTPTSPTVAPASPAPNEPLVAGSPPAANRHTAAPSPATPPAPAAATTAPAAPPSAATAPATAAQEALSQRWFWQVGAFGSEQEASRVRAELALLGVTSVTETTKMPDGRTLYRVRVGPYPSQQAAEAARGRLQAAGYQPVLVRG